MIQATKEQNSINDPIRVDWISTGIWPGRLGLTFAPGKKGGSIYQNGVVHARDVAEDMHTLARDGVQVLAPLIEDVEFDMLGMDGYHAEAEARSILIAACPIVDQHAPTDRIGFAAYIDELMTYLLNGRSVVVHCRGGLGRAGLVAACLVVQGGMPPREAIALVRATRSRHAIETAVQERFVEAFGAIARRNRLHERGLLKELSEV